jgi:hypothetical protein
MYQVTIPEAIEPTPLPTQWGELTLGQAARLADLPEGSDVYNLLSVFLNLDPVEVMNLPAVFVNEQVLPALEFLKEPMPDYSAAPHPATITLPGAGLYDARELPVMPALDVTTFGQANGLGELLLDAEMPTTRKRLLALAILFYPAYHNTGYDQDDAVRFAEQVCSGVSVAQALPITDFFLRTTVASGGKSPASSNAFPLTPTSGPQASSSSSAPGMRWLWSMHWPLGTKPSGPSSSTSPGLR